MKLLWLPLNVPGSEQVGQERGFREVFEEVCEFDYLKIAGEHGRPEMNRKLIETIRDEKPDIMWSQLQETGDPSVFSETLQEIRLQFPQLWMTNWSGDARSEVHYLKTILPHYDLFYNCTDQQMYKQWAKRVEFMPIAVDPIEVTTFKEVSGVPEIIFCGNHYGLDAFPNSKARYELMVSLTREFGDRFGVYGSGWPHGDINLLGPVAVKDQGSYYHAAKVVISMDHFSDMKYWSERRLWALASGTPTLIQNHIGLSETFPDHSYGTFGIAVDCIGSIHTLLESPKEGWPWSLRSIDPEAARENILKEHTWTQRAQLVRRDYENK